MSTLAGCAEDDYSETFIRDSEEIAEEMGGWEGVYTGSLGSA
jgi:hypothetical protein